MNARNGISRRTFLQATAATVAVSAVSSRRVYGANERVRVGLIGCRNRGPQDAEAMLKSGEFELAAMCDCDSAMYDRGAKALSKHLTTPPPHVKDFRKVLDDKSIDAVVIAVPDHWHGLMTQLVLEAGKHVYVEKPVSYNIDDGKRMVTAQEKHPKLVVACGTQQRSGKHFQEAREFLRGGGLGTVGFCRMWITHVRGFQKPVPDSAPPETLDYDMWVGPAPMQPYNKNRCHYEWRFAKNFGTGEMGNWGAHWVDIARWYLDLDVPSAAMGLALNIVPDAKETPDTQTVLYQFPKVTLLWEQRLWTKNELNGDASGAEFAGDKGSMVITRAGWTVFPQDGEPQKKPGSELMQPHVKNFAASIRGIDKPVAPIEEGHKSAVICHLGNISAGLNRRVVYDAATQSFPNDNEAQALVSREYRAPWTG